MFYNKRGIAAWISWVLMIGLSITLGVFFFHWITDYTKESNTDMATRSKQTIECEQISVRIENICQNTQALNINVTNNNNLKIDELVFRMFDVYGMPQLWEKNITLKPEKTISFNVPKQGTLKQVEIIPVMHADSKRIVCQDRKITKDPISIC